MACNARDECSRHSDGYRRIHGFAQIWPRAPRGTKNRAAVFGLALLPEFKNKGYGTEVTKFMVDYVFRSLGLHRPSLTVFEGNPGRSRPAARNTKNIKKKIGMRTLYAITSIRKQGQTVGVNACCSSLHECPYISKVLMR